MTQPRFPWALLLMLGMFGVITFSPKTPPYFQVGGALAALIVATAAIYQIIPRRDGSLDHQVTDETEFEEDPEDPDAP